MHSLIFFYFCLYSVAVVKIFTNDWGVVPYTQAFERQQAWVLERIGNKRPDSLVFVEHPGVYTLGVRAEADKHLLAQDDFLHKNNIEVVRTNRGGDITLHSPGQLVIYPIIRLEHKDLHRYLRDLEEVIIRALGYLGLAATRNEGKTGVWVPSAAGRNVPMKKIAAIGVAVKQWVTYHGAALNVENDLSLFEGIIPCGIADCQVTSLQKELKENSPSLPEVKKAIEQAWVEFF